jgi:hypothetical protein
MKKQEETQFERKVRRVQELYDYIKVEPRTLEEMSKHFGVHKNTIRNYIDEARLKLNGGEYIECIHKKYQITDTPRITPKEDSSNLKKALKRDFKGVPEISRKRLVDWAAKRERTNISCLSLYKLAEGVGIHVQKYSNY